MSKIIEISKEYPVAILLAFFLLPPLFGGLASLLAGVEFGEFVSSLTKWDEFYIASGVISPFVATASFSYLLFSPLAFLYLKCVAHLQETNGRQAVILWSGSALIFLGGIFAIIGPSQSSVITPSKGMQLLIFAGIYPPLFCLLIAALIFTTVTCLYVFLVITKATIVRFVR